MDQHDAQEYPDDRAAAAAERQAADDAGGNRLELKAGALPWLHAADPRRGEDAGNRGHPAGDGKRHQLDTACIDADRGGRRTIATGGEDVVAELVTVEQQMKADDEKNDPDEGGVDAEDRSRKQAREGWFGIEAHLHGAVVKQHCAAPEQQAAERDDE